MEAKVGLKNVASTCADRAATEPCASDQNPHWAPLFFCHYTWGVAQSAITGPVIANTSAIRLAGGELLAVETFATCPLPPLATITDAGSLNVSLTHYAASGTTALTLPWEGVPGGNVLDVSWARPPSAPPPASPSNLPSVLSGPHVGHCTGWSFVTGGQSGGRNEPPLQPGDPDYAALHNPNVVEECYNRCMVLHPSSRCFWLNVPAGTPDASAYWSAGVPVGTELCGCSTCTTSCSSGIAGTSADYRAYYW